MAVLRKVWLQLLLLIILVPVLYEVGIGLYVGFHLSMMWLGIIQTGVALIGIILFNHYVSHVQVHWFNLRRMGRQLLAWIPAILLIVLVQSKFRSFIILAQYGLTGKVLFETGYVILVAVTEEYVYRGVMLPVIGRFCHNRVFLTILIDAVLFGVVHIILNTSSKGINYTILQAVLAMAGGVIYAGLYVATHNLLWPILFHFIDDGSLIVQLGTTQRAAHIPAITQDMLGTLVLIALAFAAVAMIIVYFQTRHADLKALTKIAG